MGTRSFIVMKTHTVFKGVYCHWDGYLAHVGRILRDHYTDPVKIAELIKHGDISSLDAEIGSPHDFANHSQGQTTFYGRDRGDKNCGPKSLKTLTSIMNYANRYGCEYFYLFADGDWKYAAERAAILRAQRWFSVLRVEAASAGDRRCSIGEPP